MESASRVDLKAASGEYSILIGRDLLPHIAQHLKQEKIGASMYVIVTDVTIERLHPQRIDTLKQQLTGDSASPTRVLVYVIPNGEKSKTREMKGRIEDFMLREKCDKGTVLVALGGGVIGDMIGFVAATYYRGINFIQIPTTLLSMVDSSVGGKTAVNTPFGKNLIGAFKQPVAVYVDMAFLDTIDDRNMANGMAEVIKSGLTSMPDVFELCADNAATYRKDAKLLQELIYRAIAFKADVVMQDERDGGIRNILNFGHSVGHAVELLPNNTWLHGECVSVGCVHELMAARAMGRCSAELVQRAEKCFQAYKLPTRLQPPYFDVGHMMSNMAMDKKNKGGRKRIVMVTDVGKTADGLMEYVSDDLFIRLLSPSVEITSPLDTQAPTQTDAVNGVVVPPPRVIANGSVILPGSKSVANRALLLAALGRGPCELSNLPACEDIRVMLTALANRLSVPLTYRKGSGEVPDVMLEGMGVTSGGIEQAKALSKKFVIEDGVLHVWVENAGTVARFLTPALTLILLWSDPKVLTKVVLDGNNRMRVRPLKDLVECIKLAFTGVNVKYLGKEGCPPIEITHTSADVSASFPGADIPIDNKVSSQFVSAMLMVAPFAKESVEVQLKHLQEDASSGVQEAVSQPYIDMTIQMMKHWGVEVQQLGPGRYKVPTGGYVNPPTYAVEADASAASYPLALAAITGGRVTVNMKMPSVDKPPLQGDANFVHLLAEMGCKVESDQTSVTVTGPSNGHLLPVSSDMGKMTDTFMTAGVLMARAAQCVYATSGESSEPCCVITNVENQRVKECNRIEAMVDNLSRCGCKIRDRQDGLELFPSPPPVGCPAPTVINCHEDHRLAMCFGVYSCVQANVKIPEWRCVEKTFSDYWDVLERLGLTIRGSNAKVEDILQSSSVPSESPLVLVGMRNVGKTTLGRAAATRLGRPFVDLDEAFPFDIKAFVEKHGWDAFRQEELAVLSRHLDPASFPDGKAPVIACGGGIVESPKAIERLQKEQQVVWIHVSDEEVIRRCENEAVKPAYGQPVRDVYMRRKPLFKEVSTYEFCPPVKADDKAVEQAFCTFTRHVVSPPSPVLEGSTFLSLTSPDLTTAGINLADMAKDVDALELRVDLLADPSTLPHQIFHIRSQTSRPIVLTVRSRGEGGRFDGDDTAMAALLCEGVRCGVEFVDVEKRLPSSLIDTVVRSKPRRTRLILSQHFISPGVPPASDVQNLIRQFDRDYVDVIKVVFTASCTDDCLTLAHAVRSSGVRKPVIALAMGEAGRLSRVLNTHMTPVTHKALSTKAAPGQMTVQEIDAMRQSMGLPTRFYYVFGKPTSKSASPALYNALFPVKGVPCYYDRHETDDPKTVEAVISSPRFGGGSVTIPLKEKVAPLLHSVSEDAKIIGAVNTIYKDAKGRLVGTNTDYLALTRGLKHATSRSGNQAAKSVLVLGAGGAARAACYAVKKLGMDLFLWNRTKTKADSLASEFGGQTIVIDGPQNTPQGGFAALIGTVPGSSPLDVSSSLFTSSALPPVVIEMAYLPKETPLVKAGAAHGCECVYGIDILIWQGVEQARLYLGQDITAQEEKAATQAVYAYYEQVAASTYT